MSQSTQNVDIEAERLRNTIYTLYMTKKTPLGSKHDTHVSGCGCLLHIMQIEYGFTRS